MDMKLWKAATKWNRFNRGLMWLSGCFSVFLVALATIYYSGLPEQVPSHVDNYGAGILIGILIFVSMWLVSCLCHYTEPYPIGKKVTADNPAVLKIILDYLKREVLAPKEQFVKSVREDTAVLEKELGIFVKDQGELEGRLRTAGDEQDNAIDLSALLRINQLIPLIKQRLESLNAQIAEAETIVQPVVQQFNKLQADLDLLTNAERVARTLNALDKIDRKFPVSDQFLASLRIASNRAKIALAELVDDNKAIQAAWAEVELESTLDPEDQLRLRS